MGVIFVEIHYKQSEKKYFIIFNFEFRSFCRLKVFEVGVVEIVNLSYRGVEYGLDYCLLEGFEPFYSSIHLQSRVFSLS
jgi:hypothetical protein